MDERAPDYVATLKIRIHGERVAEHQEGSTTRLTWDEIGESARVYLSGLISGYGHGISVLEVIDVRPLVNAPDPSSDGFKRGYLDWNKLCIIAKAKARSTYAHDTMSAFRGSRNPTQHDYGQMHAATEYLRQARAEVDGVTKGEVQKATLDPIDGPGTWQ